MAGLVDNGRAIFKDQPTPDVDSEAVRLASNEMRSAVSYVFANEQITPTQLLGILQDLHDTWSSEYHTPPQIGDNDCQRASARIEVAIEQIFVKHHVENNLVPQQALEILDNMVADWGGERSSSGQGNGDVNSRYRTAGLPALPEASTE